VHAACTHPAAPASAPASTQPPSRHRASTHSGTRTYRGHEGMCPVLQVHEEAHVHHKLAQQGGEDVKAEDAGVGARLAAGRQQAAEARQGVAGAC
jgi:hypothetical protein